MVCPRCIDTVKDIFANLDIETTHVELGEAVISKSINNEEKQNLAEQLKERGFELLEDKTSKLIAQIKTTIIDQIHYNAENLNVNFSTLLSEKLNHDYTSLSKLFSTVEGITIEKYILKQKIEKVKELIIYDELNLSEIAIQLNYSSVAHLSSQFKKETGMAPTMFKKLENRNRNTLDSL